MKSSGLVPFCLLLAAASAGDAQTSAFSYRVSTLAGSNEAGDGGPATSVPLRQAQGVAVDGRGNIYVADANDHRVRRILANGTIQTFAGTGTAGAQGDQGPADLAQLNAPYGLAIDGLGNLYIADLGNARVRRVGVDGRITTIAGGGTQPLANVTSPVPATSVQLASPRNVATDQEGSVYIADFDGQRICKVQTNGTLMVVAGNGQAGSAGDGGLATLAQLNFPAGLAVDRTGTLFIADSGNNRIRAVTRGVISTIGGGARTLPLTAPTGLAIDTANNLYVANHQDGAQLVKITAAGVWSALSAVGWDVGIDAASTLYVTSAQLVQKVNSAGAVTTIAGNGTANFLGENVAATRARLAGPWGLARDDAGNLYLADERNHRIRRVSPSGTITTIAGTGQPGFSGDGGPATAAKLNGPRGVVLDGLGNLYIADAGNHRIRKLGRTGQISTVAGDGTAGNTGDGGTGLRARLAYPTGLAIARDGALLIADTGNHAIRRLATTGTIDTIAGNKTSGSTGDGGPAVYAQLSAPQGIAVDTQGNLWIADTDNHAIRRVTPAGTIQTVGQAVPSPWDTPRAILVDASGDAFIADAGNHRVARLSSNGTILSLAGGGDNASDDEQDAAAAALGSPAALLADSTGNLYFTDADRGRVRKLTKGTAVVPVPPAPITLGVRAVHGASFTSGPVAPGEILSLFGDNIGPVTATAGRLMADGTLATTLGDVQVLFDGRPGALFYARQDQINVQVPYGVVGRSTVEISVMGSGVKRASAIVPVTDAVPGIVTVANGTGQAVALNEDGTLNSRDNPASPGSIIVLYATGEGQTSPNSLDGRPAASPYARPLLPVSLRVAGYEAELLYAGSAPGLVGVMQINARIPVGFAGTGFLSVTLVVGDKSSQPGVWVSVQ